MNNSSKCKEYKKILFTCNSCGFNTNVIKNINEHVKSPCTSENNLNNKQCQLEQKIENLELENKKMMKLLTIERCKVSILTDLLKSNSSIDLSNYIMTEENTVNFYNTDDLSFNVHHTSLDIIPKNIKKDVCERKDTERKHVYRSIKKCLPMSTYEELKTDIIDDNIIEKPIIDIIQIQKDIDNQYDKIKESRIYTKILDDIKYKRWSIFGHISLEEYEMLLVNHIKKLEEIFLEKKYADKKIKQIIVKSLYALEARILYYDNYINTYIETDEMEKFKSVIQDRMYNPEITPFDENKIYKCLFNYSIVLFPVFQLLEMCLFNNKVSNVIYLPLPKSSIDNPYSFYTLEKIQNDKRYWKMDCRLEDLSQSILSNLLEYMVSAFRKIYNDVFGDNEYREKYNYTNQITECDLEQLTENIIALSKPKQFSINLQKLIIKNTKYNPTDNDKFNLYGDDCLQRKRFSELEDLDGPDIYKRLFDNITTEKIVDLYRIRTT